MSCISKSVCKLCRRENVKLFLKGDRCLSDKCAFERRPYPPGQHGQSRLKFSEFALQLREKQKAKRYYGVHEKQFRRYFGAAERARGATGVELLTLLETRFDNFVFMSGFASSRREARVLVAHGHFLVNGRSVNVPSYNVKKGDVVEVREASRSLARIMSAVASASKRECPAWVGVIHSEFKAMVKDTPVRDQVSLPVEENMIVEYYSR